MAAIVVLNSVSPSKLASELELFGHKVWEALAVSEVLFVCERHSIDAVVITPEVQHAELIEKQLRGFVLRLDKSVDAASVDSALSQLFGNKDTRIQ